MTTPAIAQTPTLDRTRFIIDYDTDYQFDECDGGPMPMTEERYKGNEYYKDGKPASYEEYLRYYGNPDRHVVVYVQRQDKCPCCDSWLNGEAVYGIDFMDDDKEAGYIGKFRLDQLTGYLEGIALELEPFGSKVHQTT